MTHWHSHDGRPGDACSRERLQRGLCDAVRLYGEFHCQPPRRVVRVARPHEPPGVVVRLGQLEGLIYSSDRGRRGRAQRFIHLLETPATLCSNPAGTQLYILGGRYLVTRRGIVG